MLDDPFSQTRVGNDTNPFVENAEVVVQEAGDEELDFSERLVIYFNITLFVRCIY